MQIINFYPKNKKPSKHARTSSRTCLEASFNNYYNKISTNLLVT